MTPGSSFCPGVFYFIQTSTGVDYLKNILYHINHSQALIDTLLYAAREGLKTAGWGFGEPLDLLGLFKGLVLRPLSPLYKIYIADRQLARCAEGVA